MNKKQQILFNTNNFLLAMTNVLDKAEQNMYQTTPNHLKRVAYLALKIGQKFNLSNEQLSDLCTYALAHSIAVFEYTNDEKDQCLKAQEIVSSFPLVCNEQNVLKYHKEYYDGSGVFRLKAQEIPLFSQIISFCDLIDTKFDLSNTNIQNREHICKYIKEHEDVLFSVDMCEIFCDELTIYPSFWLDLQHEQQLLAFIFQTVHDFSTPLDFEAILDISCHFTHLVNKNSQVIQKLEVMADYYNLEHKDKLTLCIAASLCGIGKLAINPRVLQKNDLTPMQYEEIKSYAYYTSMVLKNIMGFNDIASWASKVQERLDGSGYPFGLSANEMSFKDRLLSCLVVYESLTNKAYSNTLSAQDAIIQMKEMAKLQQLDGAIVADIQTVLVKS